MMSQVLPMAIKTSDYIVLTTEKKLIFLRTNKFLMFMLLYVDVTYLAENTREIA
jgi:hypothetical protein